MSTSIFDSASTPSLSFKDAPVGTTKTATVSGDPTKKQQSDFETGEPATWPDGNPKLAVVIPVVENGEDKNIWVPIPSALLAAFQEAQREIRRDPREGDVVSVTYTGDTPNAKNPRLNPAKNYAVKIQANSLIEQAQAPAAAPAGGAHVDDDIPFAAGIIL